MAKLGNSFSKYLSVKSKQKIAVLGGTFNPPHKGHRQMVDIALQQGQFEKLFLIPSFHPPHKDQKNLLPFYHRVQMLRLMKRLCLERKKTKISLIERKLSVPSYTWNTLRYIKSSYDTQDITLVVGMDIYQNLSSWFRYQELLDFYRWFVFGRGGYTSGRLLSNVTMINAKIFPYSSTKIRDAFLHKKQDWNDSLDQPILEYILKNHLL